MFVIYKSFLFSTMCLAWINAKDRQIPYTNLTGLLNTRTL